MNYKQGKKLLKILEEEKPDFDTVSLLIKKAESKSTINSGTIIRKKEYSMNFLDSIFVYELKINEQVIFFKTEWLDALTEEQVAKKRQKRQRLSDRYTMVIIKEDKKKLWNFFSTALKKEFHFLKTRF